MINFNQLIENGTFTRIDDFDPIAFKTDVLVLLPTIKAALNGFLDSSYD